MKDNISMKKKLKVIVICGLIIFLVFLVIIYIKKATYLEAEVVRLEADALKVFNTQFRYYNGKNLKGTEIKDLIKVIILSNEVHPYNIVQVQWDGGTYDKDYINELENQINEEKKYNVECVYDAGRIYQINIYEK